MAESSDEKRSERKVSFAASLLSGGVAGMSVDISLYPLDTLKTRLQSAQGFIKAGGFRGIYAGLSVAALGSAPGAALFFSTYEMSKQAIPYISSSLPSPVVHMCAASMAEVVACLVRVPTEVVKQRYQAKLIASDASLATAVRNIIQQDGSLGLYRGFGITIMREIPFSFIQFPLYEWMKKRIASSFLAGKRELHSYEAALCGSMSGGFAAALTTPLDVIKTRLMLGHDKHGVAYTGAMDTIKKLHQESMEFTKGPEAVSKNSALGRVFFSGVGPRVMWISIGGFIFFGAYEQALRVTSLL